MYQSHNSVVLAKQTVTSHNCFPWSDIYISCQHFECGSFPSTIHTQKSKALWGGETSLCKAYGDLNTTTRLRRLYWVPLLVTLLHISCPPLAYTFQYTSKEINAHSWSLLCETLPIMHQYKVDRLAFDRSFIWRMSLELPPLQTFSLSLATSTSSSVIGGFLKSDIL